MAIVGSLILIILSPWIIQIFFGAEFDKSVTVMQILSASIVFMALSYTYGTNYLIINHHERPLRNLTFVSSLIGLCASIPLVYFYTYIGAAITVLICRGMLGIGSYVLARKYII